MTCPRCGWQIPPGVAPCPRCGFSLAAQQTQQMQPVPPPRKSPLGWILALGLAAGVIVALVVALVFVVLRDDGDDAADLATATPSASPTETVPTETAEPSPSPSKSKKPKPTRVTKGPGDVRDEPAGLFCRDLDAEGYSYVAAVDYWRMHGQPNQMDADRNGIPCETVYPLSDVEAYWGPQGYVPDSYRGIETLPAGLFCRDLYASGYSYPQAVDYWWYWGAPDNMDADRNGIPCETVYPSSDVDQFWYW